MPEHFFGNLTSQFEESNFLGNATMMLGNRFHFELTTEKRTQHYVEYKFASAIRQYGTLLICVIGIFGNCLCMMVLFQKHNRKVSCYLYFGSIAIADNISLMNAGWYQNMVDFFPEKIDHPICSLTNAL